MPCAASTGSASGSARECCQAAKGVRRSGSIEVWLRGHETRLTERVVDDLQADVERLKTELSGRSVGVVP